MRHISGEFDGFPFTAIVGQEEMKKGLILNVVNPSIGGVLVFGEKGTAKSTAVRALAGLLPEIPAVKGCRFRCNPRDEGGLCPECVEKKERYGAPETEFVRMKVVDLPVSATEDRVVGSLDIEQAIRTGKKRFEHGVLAEANRGILYVDEINLLDDHVVDLLLDSAAMGVNTVEREGVSFSHPARFILVGTMNPEEGELRPQLLDRFGLCVEIRGIKDPEMRMEIIKRRAAFEQNSREFARKYAAQETALAAAITNAGEIVRQVGVSDALLQKIVSIAIALEADGHRGDLTLLKAAKACAALDGRLEVSKDDVGSVVKMVFLHRMKSLPFENSRALNMEKVTRILEEKDK